MSGNRGNHKQFGQGSSADNLPSVVAAAHELKSPLALIRQLSLMLETSDMTPIESTRMLRQISLTSERALRLTGDLTKSVRLSDALFQLEPINPQQLCEDIISELTPLYTAHGRSLQLKSRKRHSLLVVANRDLLRRVIMNFSDNALHYSGQKGAIELQIASIDHGSTVRLGIRDYGPGLSSDMWNKLTHGVQSLHARPQSSGLGLYIASQFADAMQARIGAVRHRDGATFYVDLIASRQLSLL